MKSRRRKERRKIIPVFEALTLKESNKTGNTKNSANKFELFEEGSEISNEEEKSN